MFEFTYKSTGETPQNMSNAEFGGTQLQPDKKQMRRHANTKHFMHHGQFSLVETAHAQ